MSLCICLRDFPQTLPLQLLLQTRRRQMHDRCLLAMWETQSSFYLKLGLFKVCYAFRLVCRVIWFVILVFLLHNFEYLFGWVLFYYFSVAIIMVVIAVIILGNVVFMIMHVHMLPNVNVYVDIVGSYFTLA